MARPRSNPAHRRRSYSLRLSDAEHALISAFARKAGLDRSAYIRLCALRGTLRIVSVPTPIDPHLLRNLILIGNNLNQIARQLNATGRRPANLDAVLDILNNLLAEAGSYGS